MKRIVIALMFVILLSGCPGYHPEMDSIEECIEHRMCQYSDKDIKTEGSELSAQLLELLVEEEDDMEFTYYNSGGGIEMKVTYYPYEILSEDNMNLLDMLYQDIIDIVDEMYEIDIYWIKVQYKYIKLHYYFEQFNDSPIDERRSATFDYIKSSDITEEQLLDYIDNHSDQLILVLKEYQNYEVSYFYSSHDLYLKFMKDSESNGYYLRTAGLAENENITNRIVQILTENNITIIEPEGTTEAE